MDPHTKELVIRAICGICGLITGTVFGYTSRMFFHRWKEFNDIADRLARFFQAQAAQPTISASRPVPEDDLFLMRRHLRGRRLRAFQQALDAYQQATGKDNRASDASGYPTLTDPAQASAAAQAVLQRLTRRWW